MAETPDSFIGFTNGRVGDDNGTRPARFEVLLDNDTFFFREALDQEQRQADLIAGKPWVRFRKTMNELTEELTDGQVQFGASHEFAVELEPDQLMALLDTQISAEQGVTTGDFVRYHHRSRLYGGAQLPPLAGDPQETVEVKALRSDGVRTSSTPVPVTIGVGTRDGGTVLGEVTKSAGGYDVFSKNVSPLDLQDAHPLGIVLTENAFGRTAYVMVPADELERAFAALPDPSDPRRSLADAARAAQGLANVQRSFDAGVFPAAGSLDSPAKPQPQPALTESELTERFEALHDRLSYQERIVQDEFHGLFAEESLVHEIHRVRRDSMADVHEDTYDLGSVVKELQAASARCDEQFEELGYAMPDVVPSRKDRYTLAYEALSAQNEALAGTVDQWNLHNPEVFPKFERYSKMVSDVHAFLDAALERAGGDRDKAAALFEQTSERFEPHLVTAGARKPEVPEFVAPVSRTPQYEPTSLQPARDTSLDNVEPTF